MHRRNTLIIISGIVLFSRSLFANQPPEPQVLIATLAMIPLAQLIFVLTGAAEIWKKKEHSSKLITVFMIIIFLISALFVAMHEGFSLLIAIIFFFICLIKASEMITIAEQLDTRDPRRPWIRYFGFSLIPITIFLAGFNFAYIGSDLYSFYADNVFDNMVEFSESQSAYYQKNHRYYDPVEKHKEIQKAQNEQGVSSLSETDCRIGFSYLDHLKKKNNYDYQFIINENHSAYSLSVYPARFSVFPYNYITRRPSFYLDESGIIRMKKVASKARYADEKSKIVWAN